ncbi:MAG: hypothetical protein KDE31_36535 [Caldilineaceae bacterium]|nr:hypothetical protein [Caldilineaceae bacterium]
MRNDFQKLYADLTAEIERLLTKARDDYAHPIEPDQTANDHAGYAYSELWVYLAHALFEFSDCRGDELAQLVAEIADEYGVDLAPTNKLRIVWDGDPSPAQPAPRIPVVGTIVDDPTLGNRVVFTNGAGHD